MNEHVMVNEEQLIEEAVQVLMREFGSIEAGHFLSIPHEQREGNRSVPLFEKEGLGEILPTKAFKNPPQPPFFKGGGELLRVKSH